MKFDAPKAPPTRGAAHSPSPRSNVAKAKTEPGPTGPMIVSGRLIGIVLQPHSIASATAEHEADADETGASTSTNAADPLSDLPTARKMAIRRNRKLH